MCGEYQCDSSARGSNWNIDHMTYCHRRCTAVDFHAVIHTLLSVVSVLHFRKHVILYNPILSLSPDHHGYAKRVHSCEQQLTGRSILPISHFNYPTFANALKESFPKSTKLFPFIHVLRASQCRNVIVWFWHRVKHPWRRLQNRSGWPRCQGSDGDHEKRTCKVGFDFYHFA